MAQALRTLGLSVAAVALSCTTTTTVPANPVTADPAVTLRQFMDAVRTRDLTGMSTLWGNERGLSSDQMTGSELQKRLTVMQIYLQHDSYELLPPDPVQTVGANPAERHFRVRLTRKNCQPEIPVTMVPFRSRWMVKSIDLAQAGNPEHTC